MEDERELKLKKLNSTFEELREEIYKQIKEKNVNLDDLAFDLGIDRVTFIEKMTEITGNYSFYLRTIDLLENWEG